MPISILKIPNCFQTRFRSRFLFVQKKARIPIQIQILIPILIGMAALLSIYCLLHFIHQSDLHLKNVRLAKLLYFIYKFLSDFAQKSKPQAST